LRDSQKEYQRRNVQPLIVMAQQPFQLKLPEKFAKHVGWPGKVPEAVLFDPVSSVSATYGVAFQTRFRGGPLSSRPTVFVIDSAGVIRHVAGRADADIREKEIFPLVDDLMKR
jgi:peroxiredoxin